MSDDRTIKSTPNPFKRVRVLIGGGTGKNIKTIWQVFGGEKPGVFFAENLTTDSCLFLEGDKGVSFKVSSKYVAVLAEMMEKFKGTQLGKAIGVIQKMADLAGGLNAGAIARNMAGGTKAGSILKGISAMPPNVRYQTKFQNLPAWESTGPVELGSFTFRFYLGMAGDYDGRTEVYNPALAFMKVNQPSEISTGVLQGPLPNVAWVYGVIGKSMMDSITGVITKDDGPVATAFKAAVPSIIPEDRRSSGYRITAADWAKLPKEKQDNFELETISGQYFNNKLWNDNDAAYKKRVRAAEFSATLPVDHAGKVTNAIQSTLNNFMSRFEKDLQEAIDSWPGTGLVQVQIGQFTLPKMTVKNTSVEFSYDTDDKGYPIWAEVTWSGCETLEIATVQQMPLLPEGAGASFDTIGEQAVLASTAYSAILESTLPPSKDVIGATSAYSKTSTNQDAAAAQAAADASANAAALKASQLAFGGKK